MNDQEPDISERAYLPAIVVTSIIPIRYANKEYPQWEFVRKEMYALYKDMIFLQEISMVLYTNLYHILVAILNLLRYLLPIIVSVVFEQERI